MQTVWNYVEIEVLPYFANKIYRYCKLAAGVVGAGLAVPAIIVCSVYQKSVFLGVVSGAYLLESIWLVVDALKVHTDLEHYVGKIMSEISAMSTENHKMAATELKLNEEIEKLEKRNKEQDERMSVQLSKLETENRKLQEVYRNSMKLVNALTNMQATSDVLATSTSSLVAIDKEMSTHLLVLQKMTEILTKEKFAFLDANADGQISLDEWLAGIKKLANITK